MRNSGNLKSFTLIELVVVLLIISILISSGTFTLIGLKNSSTVNSQTRDFVSEVKTLHGDARNSVYSLDELRAGDLSDGVGIFFIDDEFQKIVCTSVSSGIFDFSCSVDSSYRVIVHPDVKMKPLNNCRGVIFEYSTGDISVFETDQLTTINSGTGSCDVRLDHKSISFNRTVTFNAETNTISTD